MSYARRHVWSCTYNDKSGGINPAIFKLWLYMQRDLKSWHADPKIVASLSMPSAQVPVLEWTVEMPMCFRVKRLWAPRTARQKLSSLTTILPAQYYAVITALKAKDLLIANKCAFLIYTTFASGADACFMSHFIEFPSFWALPRGKQLDTTKSSSSQNTPPNTTADRP